MSAHHQGGSGSKGATSLGWLLERAQLPKEASPFVAQATDGASLVQLLLDAGRIPDALRVVATALPPREGVWWAWTAARHASQVGAEAATPAVTEALAATEHWVKNPEDGPRRAAWAASERAGLDTPAGCAAAAPFFAAGSVASPEIAVIPAPPGLYSAMIATAVTLASVAEPDRFDAVAGAFIAQGLEVVRGLGGWERSAELARQYVDAQQVQYEKVMPPPAPAAGAPPS